MPRIKMQLDLIADKGQRVPRKFLQRALQEILRELAKPNRLSARARAIIARATSVQLVFVSKSKIKRLNIEFRGKNFAYATDVLSFAPHEPGSLGEIVLALEVLKQQAKSHDMRVRDEIGYMVLHGVLHLLGYDHETSESAAKTMFRLQDKVFDAVRRRW